MDIFREGFEWFYDLVKPMVFRMTQRDPQEAHELFVKFCRGLDICGLDRLVLKHSCLAGESDIKFSNAAGFNKNGDIPPRVLKYLGFDRVNVGTVTRDKWQGNPRPSIRRYTGSESLVNWMGLPGIGAVGVAEKLRKYGDHGVPITVNLMSTPGKQGDEVLDDIYGTVNVMRDVGYVDRFELNISCPNTHGADGEIDAREDNLRQLSSMLKVVCMNRLPGQEVYVKVSPDSTLQDVVDTLGVLEEYDVSGVVTCNTTTDHNRKFIEESPQIDGKQVGGASGNAVYVKSLRVQMQYKASRREGMEIIACGGINSLARVSERRCHGAVGVQMYTPIVFGGPKLIRELREYRGE